MTQDAGQTPPQDTPPPAAPATGDDELLIDGQEEVFSRTEVERGMIEHHSLEEDAERETVGGRHHAPSGPSGHLPRSLTGEDA